MQRLRKLREDARQRFESLPWPSRTEEEWRRTDPSAFPLDQVELTPEAGAIQAGWETPSLTQPGVVLTDLETAVREFPGLGEEHLYFKRFIFGGFLCRLFQMHLTSDYSTYNPHIETLPDH